MGEGKNKGDGEGEGYLLALWSFDVIGHGKNWEGIIVVQRNSNSEERKKGKHQAVYEPRKVNFLGGKSNEIKR